ncbi:hypothetical protein DPX16_19697 [Anabarilius grahami]|uniref:Uncharacterized protein n=1 Tax=Anabarilius grahami TaxID=495550 RepID=A0A3N0XPZ8_ANAGA|nr:hypothetical protein DPX16_19697 [Anabarilius grahami]
MEGAALMDRKEPLVEPSARGPFLNALSRQLQPAERRVTNTQQLAYTTARGALAAGRDDVKHECHRHPLVLASSGKLERENTILSNLPTSSSASPMIAATAVPQHKRGRNHQAQMRHLFAREECQTRTEHPDRETLTVWKQEDHGKWSPGTEGTVTVPWVAMAGQEPWPPPKKKMSWGSPWWQEGIRGLAHVGGLELARGGLERARGGLERARGRLERALGE